MSVFRIEWPERGIAHLVMDDPERKLNVLDEGAIGDLETSLRELERAAELKGLVLRSGKPGSFVAGADVNAIASITDSAQVVSLVDLLMTMSLEGQPDRNRQSDQAT